jgi:hypothetical protein
MCDSCRVTNQVNHFINKYDEEERFELLYPIFGYDLLRQMSDKIIEHEGETYIDWNKNNKEEFIKQLKERLEKKK